MKSFLRLTDFTLDELYEIFSIAGKLEQGQYADFLRNRAVVMFFPSSSIRTRVTFEKGIHLLGGQVILFPVEALDKKEDLKDVALYLNNWADAAVIRHRDIARLEKISGYASFPVINAMTDVNHPCEIMSDLYALSKRRRDFRSDRYLFCGKDGNIGRAWKEASEVFGFSLEQCCASGYEIPGLKAYHDVYEAVEGKDIVCTDSLGKDETEAFRDLQVTKAVMDKANKGALLNPCPPFYRGEEVSEDAIESPYFVGYGFKKDLLVVQQAILIYCLGGGRQA